RFPGPRGLGGAAWGRGPGGRTRQLDLGRLADGVGIDEEQAGRTDLDLVAVLQGPATGLALVDLDPVAAVQVLDVDPREVPAQLRVATRDEIVGEADFGARIPADQQLLGLRDGDPLALAITVHEAEVGILRAQHAPQRPAHHGAGDVGGALLPPGIRDGAPLAEGDVELRDDDQVTGLEQALLTLGERLAVDLGPERAAEILDEAQLVIEADPGVLSAHGLTREHHVAALVTPERDRGALERVVHRLGLRTRGALLVNRQPNLHRD